MWSVGLVDFATCIGVFVVAQYDNPYSAPNPARDDEPSFWSWLWKALSGFLTEPTVRARLLAGTPVMQYGVLFFIDPDDKHLIHAALPLLNVSEETKKRNVEEAKRELRKLIEDHGDIEPDLRDRMLSVRFIANYQDFDDQVCEPVVTSWFESDSDEKMA